MIYGEGIGKTTAIIFYCYLSGLISEYDRTTFTNKDHMEQQLQDKQNELESIRRVFYSCYYFLTNVYLVKDLYKQYPSFLKLT